VAGNLANIQAQVITSATGGVAAGAAINAALAAEDAQRAIDGHRHQHENPAPERRRRASGQPRQLPPGRKTSAPSPAGSGQATLADIPVLLGSPAYRVAAGTLARCPAPRCLNAQGRSDACTCAQCERHLFVHKLRLVTVAYQLSPPQAAHDSIDKRRLQSPGLVPWRGVWRLTRDPSCCGKARVVATSLLAAALVLRAMGSGWLPPVEPELAHLHLLISNRAAPMEPGKPFQSGRGHVSRSRSPAGTPCRGSVPTCTSRRSRQAQQARRRSWLSTIRACRSPPARNGHCVSLSRTLAERTGGRPRSRVRGLQYSFRSVMYRMAGCRMIPTSSAGGYGPWPLRDRR
jgi:hypothetical protein